MDQANPPTQTAPALTPAREALAKAVQTAAAADGHVDEARAAVDRARSIVAAARARLVEAEREVDDWTATRTQKLVAAVAAGAEAPTGSGLPILLQRREAARAELDAAEAAQATFREQVAAAERAAERARWSVQEAVEAVLSAEAGVVAERLRIAVSAYRNALAHAVELRQSLNQLTHRPAVSAVEDAIFEPIEDHGVTTAAEQAWRAAIERLRVDPEAPLPA